VIIHCAYCGQPIKYSAAWYDSLSRTKICGKECLDKIQVAYARLIMRKESA
jgi:hypothetical protein